MKKLIFLDDIKVSESPTVRASLNEAVVLEYAERYQSKEEMPPVHVFADKETKTLILADGSHRLAALLKIGRKAIEAEVHSGGYQDALKFALLANTQHGLPRSSEDKRVCIRSAIKEWPNASKLQIAKMCDVDDKTVSAVLAEMEADQVVEVATTRVDTLGRSIPKRNDVRNSERPPKTSGQSKVSDSPKPKPDPQREQKDATGHVIPMKILPYWDRAPEVKDILATISKIINHLKEAQEKEDRMYAEVSFASTIGDLDKAWHSIKCALPYAVCTACAGHPDTQKGGCRLCMGRGLICKFRYDRLVLTQVKQIREGAR